MNKSNAKSLMNDCQNEAKPFAPFRQNVPVSRRASTTLKMSHFVFGRQNMRTH